MQRSDESSRSPADSAPALGAEPLAVQPATHTSRSKAVQPEVTSPGALRLLDELRKRLKARGIDPDSPQYQSGEHYVDIDYREWVMLKLRGSDIAQQIAAGAGNLPDVPQLQSSFWADLLRIKRSDTVARMVDHLALNLEGYLDPSTEQTMPPKYMTLLGVAVLTYLWLTGKALSHNFDPRHLYLIGGVLLSGACFALFVQVMLVLRTGSATALTAPGSPKYLVNCIELYHHLKQAYADLPELEGP